MGHGIAQVFALAGHDVAISDRSQANLDSVKAAHPRQPARPRRRRDGGRARAAGRRPRRGVRDADYVVEAVLEDLPLKQKLFAEIEKHVRPDTILASNTSVIPITAIMQGLRDRARALGTHWWNPPFLVPLVEVIGTQWTSPAGDRLHHGAARRRRQEAGACEEGRARLHRQPAAARAVARGDRAGRARHLRRRDRRCGDQGGVRPPACRCWGRWRMPTWSAPT